MYLAVLPIFLKGIHCHQTPLLLGHGLKVVEPFLRFLAFRHEGLESSEGIG